MIIYDGELVPSAEWPWPMGGGGVHVGWQSGGGTRRRWKYRWTGDLAIANALLAMDDEMDGCFPFHFHSWCCVQFCLYIGMTKTNSDTIIASQ